jgi:hypothetical protein
MFAFLGAPRDGAVEKVIDLVDARAVFVVRESSAVQGGHVFGQDGGYLGRRDIQKQYAMGWHIGEPSHPVAKSDLTTQLLEVGQ